LFPPPKGCKMASAVITVTSVSTNSTSTLSNVAAEGAHKLQKHPAPARWHEDTPATDD
jgi:hypothetical protein